ncbi:hypothetical protein SUNI508_08550 [Seiridium unicorne]|uniref:Uncharacterized protein n=1 Tax=Seiridium unicorne TaxID=138068 RepID=A0ABR2UTF3_9PEZI
MSSKTKYSSGSTSDRKNRRHNDRVMLDKYLKSSPEVTERCLSDSRTTGKHLGTKEMKGYIDDWERSWKEAQHK